MRHPQTLAVCTLVLALMPAVGHSEDLRRYRNFELGTSVGAISTVTGVAATDVKTIHERPALLQDLEWRLSQWLAGSSAASTDPVKQILFSFVNDRLFRIVVDYDHDRTEGMTDADMIEALSTVYAAPVKRAPGPARVVSRVEAESGSPLARWGDASYSAVLYRTSSYRSGFRLIVTDSALDTLAQKAAIQAVRLDDQEAPRREVARLKKEQDDTKAAAEKARIANKKVFRP